MIKIIKSFLASSAHLNALSYLSQHKTADALGQVSKAIRLETNEKYLVKHLVLRGEIWLVVGKSEESLSDFKQAGSLVLKYPAYFSKGDNNELVTKVD